MPVKSDACGRNLNTTFTLRDSLFGAVKLTKTDDPDKYSYSECGIGFDWRSLFSFLKYWDKIVIIFGVGNSSSVHTDNKRKIC